MICEPLWVNLAMAMLPESLAAMVRARRAALKALPEGLRAAAEKPDLTPAPLHRHMAEHTHAVPGFSAAVRKAGAKAEGGDSDNPLAGIVG